MNRKISLLALFVVFILACGEPPTPIPTVDIQAVIAMTQTAAATALPASTDIFTFTPFPTDTPGIIPAQTLVLFATNTAPAQAACSCSGDALNCTDFGSSSQAQACYDYCISVGVGDVHQLDNNDDGVACENP